MESVTHGMLDCGPIVKKAGESALAFTDLAGSRIVGQPEVIAVRRLLYDRPLPDCPSAIFSARTWAEPITGHRWSIANGADMAVRTQTERAGSSLLCVYLQPGRHSAATHPYCVLLGTAAAVCL